MKLVIGNLEAEIGQKTQGYLNIVNSDIKVPCTLINGIKDGKTVVITGGTHGGEYPGIEAAIQLAKELMPNDVSGKIIIVHPLNVPAFQAKLQYVGPYDGKNLNREYPGLATGTVTQKIAYTVTNQLHSIADFYMDLHGGDLHESLEPFVIYSKLGTDLVNKISKEAASLMGIKYICGSVSDNGSFGSAAKNGVPGFLAEIGQCGLWSEDEVSQYKAGVINVLKYLQVLEGMSEQIGEVIDLEKMNGLNATVDGCWYSNVIAGQKVSKGEQVGEIRDYFGNVIEKYVSPINGVILYTASSLAINVNDPIIAVG
ncbi:MAG: succinylglutamate desuccinylase/aspartoacylase family protein [Tissierellales bacterium]|nr:succinylglutamate desuccinylase/aspartoacylase family protein [Tissierellales bacterium]MBN2828116.1 succinylglutamate desuccinylase/aspartoacylase family protein [Tissierellales bacterium]